MPSKETSLDPRVLGDKNQFPTEKIILSHIGRSKTLWQAFFEYLHEQHPELAEEWRYYNDGKSWLMKVTRKSKTVFWLSVIRDAFQTTFYFTAKAEEAIVNSSLSNELKEQFKSGKNYGKIRGLTIVFRNEKDIENAKILLALKLSIK
jgi:hypothetical protein